MTTVPNQPKTPSRTFRIPDDVYDAAREKAAELGVPLSEVVRDLLDAWVSSENAESPPLP